jgi:hypothetical protein
VNAVVALLANLLVLLAAMAWSHATLTLPGIAGIILTYFVSKLLFEWALRVRPASALSI